MDYKNKYLKYKNKYLYLKNIVGGGGYGITLHFNNLTEIKQIKASNIDLINKSDHILVPMNSYEIVDKDNKNILSTTGLVDCVAIAIYNPKHGRFFAHYLKYNEFLEDLSNACQILGDNTECMDTKYINNVKTEIIYPVDCDNSSSKIKSTLPAWINDTETRVHILNNSNVFKTLSRLNQLKTLIFKGTINIYFPKIDYRDTLLIKRVFATIPKIDDIIRKLSSSSDILPEIYMMLDNGEICYALKNDLESDKSLFEFYKSITVNRIASYHDNKKCVKKYSLKKSFYEVHKEEYTEASKLPNMYTDFKKQTTTNAYQNKFNEIK